MADKLNKQRATSPSENFQSPRYSIPASDQAINSISGLKNQDPFAEELIRSLSDSTENRRARQVFEWETIRRNMLSRAARS